MPKRRPVKEPLTCSWTYPSQLPVSQAREDILQALHDHSTLILCGATGSGKSTQLPKFCLEAGLGSKGLIAHTQPRRLAARALAERLSEELDSEVGGLVGWQVRFKSVMSEETRVKLMTDGVLLAEMRKDRELRRYDTIIVDEAHERSLNIDFLLGYLQQLRQKRPELKIIITSATLDAEKFSRHFDNAPVIEVPGKSHPIDLRYRDPQNEDAKLAVLNGIREIWRNEAGDILVFLPGEREIRECAEFLQGHPQLKHISPLAILPLYARLGSAKQQQIFHPGAGRRVVLATNVAETSLTVPGIHHVIDTGQARISRYNPRSKIQSLGVEAISQASANQRKGRCGRTAPGVCLRLYSEEDFDDRPEYTDAEIQRTNLAAVVLQMAELKLGAAEDFPFIDPPHTRYLRDARRLLKQLQALDDEDKITAIGRQLARLPLDPRLGRILIAAHAQDCLADALAICAALSMQDPRDRNFDNRQKADQAQAPYRDKNSDFLTLLNIWKAAQEQRKALSNKQFQQWCDKHFLHRRRMQEWRDLHKQIRGDLLALDLPPKEHEQIKANALHQSMLHGLLDHIALHDEQGEYKGPRGSRWRIHPESTLAKRQPSWMMAAEIVTTKRTYARMVAQVEADWIEQAAPHLLQKKAVEPYWDKKRGEVMAFEHVSLFGLPLITQRRVPFARYELNASRQMFIEHALVAAQWGQSDTPAFLKRYLRIRRELEQEEARQRRQGILRPDEEILHWFAERIPSDVRNRRALLRFLKREGDENLLMQEADLRVKDSSDLDQDFPSSLELHGLRYKLQYSFNPGAEDDGVSLNLPLNRLKQIDAGQLDWLVPGLLSEKISYILKALPKQQRRQLVPVNESVEACLQQLRNEQGGFYPALSRSLNKLRRLEISAQQLASAELPDKLKLRIVLRNEKGGQIATGRDLSKLQKRFGQQARAQIKKIEAPEWERDGLKDWDCPSLPDVITLPGKLQAYPYLQDAGDSVNLRILEDPQEAQERHRLGLLRLFLLKQNNSLKQRLKSLPKRQELLLQFAALPAPSIEEQHILDALNADFPSLPDLSWDCAARAIAQHQVAEHIRDAAGFEKALNENSAAVHQSIRKSWDALCEALNEWKAIRPFLDSPKTQPADADFHQHIQALIAPGFVYRISDPQDLPRYLKAARLRAEKRRQQPQADLQRHEQIRPFQAKLEQALTQCVSQKRKAGPALREFHQLLAEYRVSLFAQQLRTKEKVSTKRLQTAWQRLLDSQN